MKIISSIISERQANDIELARFTMRQSDYTAVNNGLFARWDGMKWEQRNIAPVELFESAIDLLRTLPPSVNRDAAISRIANGTQRISALIDMTSRIDVNLFDAKPNLLNTQSGVVNLTDGKLELHSREYMLSHITKYGLSCGKPVEWLRFIDAITCDRHGKSDSAKAAFLDAALGYALTGETSEQCLFYLEGIGVNGKSLLLNVMRDILGDYAITASPTIWAKSNTSAIRNDLAMLKGKRFVVLAETEEDTRVDEVLVKRITGGDSITARFLYREIFEFRPNMKVFIASNYPVSMSSSDANWRRIRAIRFEVSFKGREDKMLYDKLISEAPMILNRLVSKAVEWYKHGLPTSSSVAYYTQQMREVNSSVRQFASDWLTISLDGFVKNPVKYSTPTDDVYARYRTWCSDEDITPVSKHMFSRELVRNFPLGEIISTPVRRGDRTLRHYRPVMMLPVPRSVKGLTYNPDYAITPEMSSEEAV